MLNYKSYFNDLLRINKNSHLTDDKSKIYHYTNTLDDKYLNKLRKIIDKYNNIKDDNDEFNYELKIEIDSLKKYLSMKIYLYYIISSFHNEIIIFEYYNKKVYKPYEYKIQREKDFHNYLQTVIKRLNEGLELNISIPYIICMKILEQLKNYKKYKYFYNYFKNVYIPKCTKLIGLCHQPNGKKIYKYFIQNYLTLNKSPEYIHKLGLSLLPKENYIHKDEYFESKETLFAECKKISLYIYNNIIEKYFYYKPDKPFTIKIVPKNLESSSSLAYYNPSEDAVFINLKFYKEIDKKGLYSLIMHECFHQYHYKFMKYYKIEKYKIYGFNNITLIEGFAHYIEDYLDDNNENNYYSILRIVRLIVDTGINYYGWTYKKAFNFMLKYFPNNTDDIINEIDRYICMPGQSLCYVIGKLEIIKMRDKFLKSNKGNIKDFHHNLLINGTCSFKTIQKKINKII